MVGWAKTEFAASAQVAVGWAKLDFAARAQVVVGWAKTPVAIGAQVVMGWTKTEFANSAQVVVGWAKLKLCVFGLFSPLPWSSSDWVQLQKGFRGNLEGGDRPPWAEI